MIIAGEPSQAPPEPGTFCQAGSSRRADRHLSIPNGRREIAAGIIAICCVAVKLRAIHVGSITSRVLALAAERNGSCATGMASIAAACNGGSGELLGFLVEP